MRLRTLWLCSVLAVGCSSSGSLPDHEVLVHSFSARETGLATGEFSFPAKRYGVIRVDPRYRHALTFQMTHMMPPLLRAAPSNGPLILYSDDLEVLVFSPLDHFYVSLIHFENGQIVYGLEGDVKEIPSGFVHRFLLLRGKGINATLERWGELLRADRGRSRVDRYGDPGLSSLGYWTDNGSAYYYKTEPGLNEESTLLSVLSDARARGIPFGNLQLDSWWYEKEEAVAGNFTGGLIRWEPQPGMFPDGLASFAQKLGLPLIAHNRWFAVENAYRDRFEFVESGVGADGGSMALPLGSGVFEELMRNARSWGITTYEQDWLMKQYWGLPYLRDGVDHAELWMKSLHDAAQAQGMTIQLCMAGAAHLMDAVDRPATTTLRTSMDYRPEVSKSLYWPLFHQVNLLAWAIGIWPFKDNFRSAEPYAEAEALISNLSAGMVGASDAVGSSDATLLARTCRADGLLLKPDKPATPLDAMFLPHVRPFLTSTYSHREGLGRWTYLSAYRIAGEDGELSPVDRLMADVNLQAPLEDVAFIPFAIEEWQVDLPRDLGIEEPVVAYDWRTRRAAVVSASLQIPPIHERFDHAYLVLAPVFDNGLSLIGEPDKFVTVSDRRFASIEPTPDSIRVVLQGVAGETVSLLGYDARAGHLLAPRQVTVGPDGFAEALLSR